MNEFLTRKELTEKISKGMRTCLEGIKLWHGHWKHLQKKADQQHDSGNNEQWEAYAECMNHIEDKIFTKCRELGRLRDTFRKMIMKK